MFRGETEAIVFIANAIKLYRFPYKLIKYISRNNFFVNNFYPSSEFLDTAHQVIAQINEPEASLVISYDSAKTVTIETNSSSVKINRKIIKVLNEEWWHEVTESESRFGALNEKTVKLNQDEFNGVKKLLGFYDNNFIDRMLRLEKVAKKSEELKKQSYINKSFIIKKIENQLKSLSDSNLAQILYYYLSSQYPYRILEILSLNNEEIDYMEEDEELAEEIPLFLEKFIEGELNIRGNELIANLLGSFFNDLSERERLMRKYKDKFWT